MVWKSIALVQFQSQFILVISLGIFISYSIILYETATALSIMKNELPLQQYMTDTKGAVFAFDAFYFVDIILMVLYKNCNWPDLRNRYPPRNSLIVWIEAFSLIPIDAIYYNIAPIKSPSAVAILRTRYVVRLIRAYCQYKIPRSIMQEPSKIRFCFSFFVVISMVSGTIGFVIQVYICQLQCPVNSTNMFVYNLYVATEKVTGKGFGKVFYHDKLDPNSFIYYALSICSFSYFVVFAYVTAKVISTYFPLHKSVYSFLIQYTSIKEDINNWKNRLSDKWTNYEDSLLITIKTYFCMVWERKTWYLKYSRGNDVLPVVMFRELDLDVAWNALKHSHLFKNEEVYFLREVARRMEHESYAEGEILYARGHRKGRMLYIKTGIVQILSEENGETPILSFSGGTCLGESSLILDYPTSWTVVCKTYCEVAYLRQNDFITICQIYPHVYHRMHRTIMERYAKAKHLEPTFKFQWSKFNVTNPKTVTMAWLKATLHHLIGSYYKEPIHWDHSLTFYPRYLDLLVITQDIELVSDKIFLKKKFPPVFQTDSIFLHAWNAFMAIISLITVLLFPLYMLECKKFSSATHGLIYLVVTIFCCIDTFVQSTTAVRTKDSLLSNIPSIINYRLTHLGYLIDLFAILPFSIFLRVIDGTIQHETLMLCESHKLLKAYRIKFVFTRLESLNFLNRSILNCIRVFAFDFFLFYYTATVFYCITRDENIPADALIGILKLDTASNAWYILLHLYTSAALFMGNMTYLDFIKAIPYYWIPIIICIQFIYVYVTIFILAYASITEASKQSNIYQYKEFVSTIDMVLKDFKVEAILQKRVKTYLKDHFWFDKGLKVLLPHLMKDNMSSNLFSLTEQILHGTFLQNTSLFHECDDLLIREASRRIKVSFYPEGEVVAYSGQVSKEIHMIKFGFCQVSDGSKLFRPGDSFGILETCLRIPMFYTVVTVTDCKILSMSYEDYVQLTVNFPDFKKSIELALQESGGKEFVQEEVTYRFWEYMEQRKTTRNEVPIIRLFYCKEIKKMYETDFNTWKVVLIHLLMACSFPSNGRFIYYWEISRSIFAFATNILFGFADFCYDCPLYYILLFLDITSWIDLYVRLHVSYFNEYNVEVSHPLVTAKYYLKNGFLIDFIAAAPLDYLGIDSAKSYLRTNRVLQLHRTFNFVRYINNNSISRSKLYDIAKYIPVTILLLNYLSNLGYYLCCGGLSKILVPQPSVCNLDAWTDRSFNKSAAPLEIKRLAASMILTTMSATLISFTKLHLESPIEMFASSIMILCGHMLFVWITAKLVANSFYRKTDLTQYQEAMKQLLAFVNYKKVDKNIKTEIINHFENMWRKTRGKNIVLLLNSFSSAIKVDILFDMFGASISTSSLFPNAPIGFFKSLLEVATYEVYIHKGIIYHVNDVHGNVFILLKGNVEIIGPDYSKLSLLSPGSAFGNLDTCEESRQTLMMVAKGNVEVLKISANHFHWVLSKYPSFEQHFKKLTAINVDYIKNTVRKEKYFTSSAVVDNQNSYKEFKYCSILMGIFDYNKYIRLLQTTIVFLSCFCGYHMEIYQLAVYEDNPVYLLVLYLFDLLYLLRMYLHFHTTFTDETGLPVRNRRRIAKRYLGQTLGFYFDLVSSTPFEIISLAFIGKGHFIVVFTWLRKNRLLRIIVCLYCLKRGQDKLNVNIKVMRLFYLATWTTVVIQSMASLMLGFNILEGTDALSASDPGALLRAYLIIIYTSSGASLTGLEIEFNLYIAINTIVLMLVCRFSITIFITETCATLEIVRQSKKRYQSYALELKYIMKENDISRPLTKRIGEYFNLLWIHHKGVQFPPLLKESPYYLREAILNALYGFHLRKHPLFKHCHKDLIRQMAATFDVMIFFPGNFLTFLGDMDGYMYFIHCGEVNALVDDTIFSETAVDTFVTGDCIGLDQGLYNKCAHSYTYKVTKKSTIIGLNRKKWFHLLQFFPASKRVLFDLRNEYIKK